MIGLKGCLRILALALSLNVASSAMAVVELPDEDLNYVILYKWGIINKEAATAVLSLRSDADNYYAQLAAKTVPWADKVFMVRDTLKSVMMRPSCMPTVYKKITHEGAQYNYDVVTYLRNGNEVTGDALRERSRNGGPIVRSDTVLHATGLTVDMLSVFYYLRTVDFVDMKPGTTMNLNVFSGRNVEQLCVRYCGIEDVNLNGRRWQTYRLSCTFTMRGKTTSDALDTWISTDASRIPVKLEGQLPLGKVHAFFTGATKVQ